MYSNTFNKNAYYQQIGISKWNTEFISTSINFRFESESEIEMDYDKFNELYTERTFDFKNYKNGLNSEGVIIELVTNALTGSTKYGSQENSTIEIIDIKKTEFDNGEQKYITIRLKCNIYNESGLLLGRINYGELCLNYVFFFKK